MTGQYPMGGINWGNGSWYLSAPWGPFTTNSISFNGFGTLSASFNFIGMNRDKWNQLSEADRSTIREVSAQAMRREMDALKLREDTIIADMEKAGAKFHVPSAAEKKRLHDAVRPLWQEVRKAVGPDGVKLADILEPMQK